MAGSAVLMGVSALPVAVGMYLGLGTATPIFVGGLLRWLSDRLRDSYQAGATLNDALAAAAQAISSVEERTFEPQGLEVAVLDRGRTRRKFRRLSPAEVGPLLEGPT